MPSALYFRMESFCRVTRLLRSWFPKLSSVLSSWPPLRHSMCHCSRCRAQWVTSSWSPRDSMQGAYDFSRRSKAGLAQFQVQCDDTASRADVLTRSVIAPIRGINYISSTRTLCIAPYFRIDQFHRSTSSQPSSLLVVI